MKLYYFNPNSWGAEYFVTSSSKNEAHVSLLNHLKKRSEEDKCYGQFYKEDLEEWQKVDINNPDTFPKGYTLDVIEPNTIVQTEIS